MEKLTKKRTALAIALAGGLTALTGCSNYSGNGNEFTVRGVVTDVGEKSIEADVYQVVSANGKASGWLDDNDVHRFHDNCDCHGFWNSRKTYGEVYDYSGAIISLSDIDISSCVEIAGKIRDHNEGKTHSTRPVFDTAQVVPCE